MLKRITVPLFVLSLITLMFPRYALAIAGEIAYQNGLSHEAASQELAATGHPIRAENQAFKAQLSFSRANNRYNRFWYRYELGYFGCGVYGWRCY